MAIAFTFALQNFGESYVTTGRTPVMAVAVVTGSLFNIWFLLIVSFLPLVFPDGHSCHRRWRPCSGSTWS